MSDDRVADDAEVSVCWVVLPVISICGASEVASDTSVGCHLLEEPVESCFCSARDCAVGISLGCCGV